MIKKIENQINSLLYTLEQIQEKKIQEFYENIKVTLTKGHKIIVSALGKNVPVAEKFVGTMNSIGLKANFLHTNNAIHGDFGIVEKDDLVILISKSGNTSETVYLAEHLKKFKINFYAVTFNSENSKLEKICHKNKIILLDIVSEGDQWNLVPNNSTITYLVFLQAISMELIDDFRIHKSVLKRNHPGGSIGEKLL